MYKSFIEFKTQHINTIDKYDTIFPHSVRDIDDKLFNCWVTEVHKNRMIFEIDSCIIKDFPLHEQCMLISRFIPSAYRYTYGAREEIVKLIYLLWNTYMLDQSGNTIEHKDYNGSNELDNLIFESLHTLKTELLSMRTLTADKVWVIEKGGEYYNWHLLGCIPLLGDDGLPILRNVITLPYEDAQDLLMFGLYQYEPNAFYQELKNILLYWHTHQNIPFESGTGMLYQLAIIIHKYQLNNLDLLSDPELLLVFNESHKKYIIEQLDQFEQLEKMYSQTVPKN
ncbi:MAG: putative orfan [Homavirus sp.]|uniref:Putative orfan n=1 Tax=Homavirus sp. TaxID=2487769 RepID=A0A3G5A789_9VIRU|nr:MAG: putative orfan [Homavirus sp.]